MTSDSTLALRCPQCGSDQFIHPADANLESRVTCKGCGTVFTGLQLAHIAASNKALHLADEAARAALGHVLKKP